MFTMLREKVTENILKQVYFACAQCHIMYSIVLWGASPHVEGVFIAQKRVVRAMAGLRYTRSNCAALKMLLECLLRRRASGTGRFFWAGVLQQLAIACISCRM
jgi:acetylglutamate kinase